MTGEAAWFSSNRSSGTVPMAGRVGCWEGGVIHFAITIGFLTQLGN